jgi:hypothetical protein
MSAKKESKTGPGGMDDALAFMADLCTQPLQPGDKQCCLCGGNAGKYGNNPAPLPSAGGVCCELCNFTKVIPVRLGAR